MSGQVMLARLSAQQCHKGILTCCRFFARGSRAVHQLQQDTKSILPIFQTQQPAWSQFFDKMRWCPMYTPIHIHTYPYTCWSPHSKLQWSASQATRGIFSTAWSRLAERVLWWDGGWVPSNDHISHLGKRNIIFKSAIIKWWYVTSQEGNTMGI